MTSRLTALMNAAPVAAGHLSAPAVQANPDGDGLHGKLHGSRGFRPGIGRDFHRGRFVGGVFLGLGTMALAGGVIVSQACYAL